MHCCGPISLILASVCFSRPRTGGRLVVHVAQSVPQWSTLSLMDKRKKEKRSEFLPALCDLQTAGQNVWHSSLPRARAAASHIPEDSVRCALRDRQTDSCTDPLCKETVIQLLFPLQGVEAAPTPTGCYIVRYISFLKFWFF